MLNKLIFQKSNTTLINLFRSIVSSVLSFFVDFLLLVLLVEIFNIYYLISAIFSFLLGSSVNYYISAKWVFSNKKRSNKKTEYLLFILIGAICFILNIVVMWFFTEYIGLHYTLSKLISGITVFLINFLGRKYIVFN